ncbi:MAG: hypothetical protein Q9208_000430 [Pyrenodesmia sp. 3 TL-2023]
MPIFKLSRTARLLSIITISLAFFVAEITVGFSTHSLALIADAFHYLGDLLSYVVALVALKMSERADVPGHLSFGWQRAQLLGAFFNGVFLVALALSIFFQSIERFVTIQEVKEPTTVLIMGCVGLGLNLISALFIHEHHHHGPSDHDHEAHATSIPSSIELPDTARPTHHHDHKHHKFPLAEPSAHDLGMLGVLLHLLSDAINNLGVIVAALVIRFARSHSRFYADPGVSMGIAFMILLSSYPLLTSAGSILLQAAPLGVDLGDVKHDMERIEGVMSVHELHAWRLSQHKAVATAHVVVKGRDMEGFMAIAEVVGECLHAYGIHSVTLQPELLVEAEKVGNGNGTGLVRTMDARCRIRCGRSCESLKCCA